MGGIAGPITHSERSKEMIAVTRHLRGWADFFVLISADLLVHTRSSFAEMAGALSCRPAIYFRHLHLNETAQPLRLARGYCDYWANQGGIVKPFV